MLSEQRLRGWLEDVRRGRRSVGSVVAQLKHFPTEDLGFAQLDTHRMLRRGLPEAVFCPGKTPEHIITLARRMIAAGTLTLLTRLDASTAQRVCEAVAQLRYDPLARLAYWQPGRRATRRGLVAVVSAGTADLPVAEEAARTLELFGSRVARVYDVGVAGLHRVLAAFETIQRARAIVVVAGMEGALASVVGGLAKAPVVAVPTSVGYGAAFGGIGPLLTMLNSCAPGVGVVNIDNGFGAAYLAHLINQAGVKRRRG